MLKYIFEIINLVQLVPQKLNTKCTFLQFGESWPPNHFTFSPTCTEFLLECPFQLLARTQNYLLEEQSKRKEEPRH